MEPLGERKSGFLNTSSPDCTRRATAIKLSVYWNAKPQLGIRVYRAKLGLGVPSKADFATIRKMGHP